MIHPVRKKSTLLYPIRHLGAAAVIIIICAALLYWDLAVGVNLERGFAWDEPIMLALHNLSRPWLDHAFFFATESAALLAAIPVLIVFIYLWRRGDRITAVIYVLSVIVFPLISLVLKNSFGRPRQSLFIPLVSESTYSFPSGHTLTAAAVYGLAAVLLWQRDHRMLALLSASWVMLVGLSRIYLGAHYPSDVLASLAVGIILVIIFLFIDGGLNRYALKRANRVQESL
ncbi:MAG: phosphatase PAP2 family protein [Candidatus Promineifilaceae bacterium]|nr:phosphatase PAP2 family protein [Candidatus Promineifilaceae bacterium]